GQLPLPLIARVEDSSGNPIANVGVVWQPLDPQSASLSSVVSTSDANGIVSATVFLSSFGPAQIQLRIAAGTVQTLFNLQGAVTLTGITVLDGIDQEAAPGSAFAQPVVLQVFSAGGPAAGLQVQLTSSGASISLPNGGVALTDSAGRATVSIQAGSTPG